MTNTLIKRLRHAFQLPDSITDSEVLAVTKNTLAKSCIELGIAMKNLKCTVKQSIRDIFKNNRS